ncbi:MAG: hypothetical protein HYX68_25045 [Planctomycetes bacterium]|nr:hypothetical protein [Planctomycetota bacterium]
MVALYAILFGILLTALGGGMYFATDMKHITALIPAFVGIPLIALGGIATIGDKARKHAMHVAAVLALIGTSLALGRVVVVMMKPDFEMNAAVYTSICMALLCAGFLGLCIKSFVDARKARQQAQNQTPQ